MVKNSLISVIIPVYNGEKTLFNCLNSVAHQSYKNYEIIVVDNNSTDNTKKIIYEFKKNNNKIKYSFEPKKGRGAARNKGILLARGEIIAMTDSDCIVEKNWLKELIRDIISKKERVVMGFEHDLIKNFWTKNYQELNSEFIKKNLNGDYVSHLDTKNFAIETKLIKKLMIDSSIENIEDFDLYLRIKNISRIRFRPEIKVGHYHKSNFKNVIKINFNRATNVYKIFQKHKNDISIKNEPMFSSLKLLGFLLFPIYIITKFLQEPFDRALFRLISETSWRIGLIYGFIKKIIQNAIFSQNLRSRKS